MTSKSTSLRIAQITKRFYELNPGKGRSRYLSTKGGFAICARCCCMNQRKLALNDHWEIVEDADNVSSPYLFCDNCGDSIPRLK